MKLRDELLRKVQAKLDRRKTEPITIDESRILKRRTSNRNINEILSNLEHRAVYYRVMMAESKELHNRLRFNHYSAKLEATKDILIDIYDNRPLALAYINKIKEYSETEQTGNGDSEQ